MNNNRGQALVLFVLFLPVLMLILAWSIDTVYLNYEKQKLDGITTSIMENLKNYPGADEKVITELFEDNDRDIEVLKSNVQSDKISISLKKEIPSLFGRIIGYNTYSLKLEKDYDYEALDSIYAPVNNGLYLHFTGIDALNDDNELVDRTGINKIDYFNLSWDKKDHYYSFNGKDSRITNSIDFENATNYFTIQMLFRTKDVNNYNKVLVLDFYDIKDQVLKLTFRINNGVLEVYDDSEKIGETKVNPISKYYVEITKDDNGLNIYLDNELLVRKDIGFTLKSIITNIGMEKDDNSSFDGGIYTYRIYNRLLTDEERSKNYSNALKEYTS